MASPHLLRPRTPVRSTESSGWEGSLPTEVVQQTCRRIGAVGLVFAGLWTLLCLMSAVVFPLLGGGPIVAAVWPFPGSVVAGVGILSSLVLAFLARRLGARPQLLLDMGSAFLVTTCLLFGILTQWNPPTITPRVSWVALFILLYAALVPNTPRRTLLTSLLAASMEPIGLWVAHLRGVQINTSLFYLTWDFLPNFVMAVLVVIPARIIRGLSRQVERARELGSYRLEKLLGKGGMGEVYRASHRMLARPAAVKVIRSEVIGARSPDEARVLVERFRREAEAATSLRSPHTISLYDFGAGHDGTFFFVMELLEGLDLEALVDRFGPVPPARAVHLLRQVCHSLDEAHARGLVHRDIKPSNIFTCRMGLEVDFVKVLDFGLVKATGEDSRERALLTAPDAIAGTPAYIAPEMVRGDAAVDHRADIYAVGCVGYWLLTGHRVFEAVNAVQTMFQHAHATPVPPSHRSETEIPPELEELILICLAKRPEDRPRTAGELSRLLAAVPGEPWSGERAAQWWERHRPESVRPPSACDHLMITKTFGAESEGGETGPPQLSEAQP